MELVKNGLVMSVFWGKFWWYVDSCRRWSWTNGKSALSVLWWEFCSNVTVLISNEWVSRCERLLMSWLILLRLRGKGVGLLSLQLVVVVWRDCLPFDLHFLLLFCALWWGWLCFSLFVTPLGCLLYGLPLVWLLTWCLKWLLAALRNLLILAWDGYLAAWRLVNWFMALVKNCVHEHWKLFCLAMMKCYVLYYGTNLKCLWSYEGRCSLCMYFLQKLQT